MIMDILEMNTLLGSVTYPIPAGTFESMIFRTSPFGGICTRSLEGNPSVDITLFHEVSPSQCCMNHRIDERTLFGE